MGKDSKKNSKKAVRNFNCTGFLTIFVKQFTKFDSLIQIYFHNNNNPALYYEKNRALKELSRKLKTGEDVEYMGSLCRKLYHLMYKKFDGLLKRCKSRKYPLEYALILGPKWLREAEPKVQLLPVVANKTMARQPAHKSWGVWELNTELIENAIRAVKAGIPMIDPVVVRDLSNNMKIDSSVILEHWERACHFVRQALQSQTAALEDSKQVIDWAIADFLLLYDPNLTLVDKKTLSYKEQVLMLNDLYTLTTLHNIEELLVKRNYSDLLEAWIRIYTSLKRCVMNISLVFLQRTWYDLKYQARVQVQQYLQRDRQPPVPDMLLQDIVCNFNHVLRDPFPRWSYLVESNLVVQIKRFGEKGRNDIHYAGPSRSNAEGDIFKQPDNPISISDDEIVSISSTIENEKDEPTNKLSSLSIDLLNNIDPSKAKISLIIDSDSDEETIDASETGSNHDIPGLMESEENTTKSKVDTEDDNEKGINTENETNCIAAEIDNINTIDTNKDETKSIVTKIEDSVSVDEEKDKTEPIAEIEQTVSIDVVKDKTESNIADNISEKEIAANEQIPNAEVEKGATDEVVTEIGAEAKDKFAINHIRKYYSNTKRKVGKKENVSLNVEVTSGDNTDNKLIMMPIVPLERCDLTTAWKLHFKNNTIDSREIPGKRFLHPSIKPKSTKNPEINLPITTPNPPELKLPEIVKAEPIEEKPQIENLIKVKEEPLERNHYETRRSSRRIRNIRERKQSFRQRRIGEAQIRNALSTLSKNFLENDRNIKLLLKCRPLTVDLVRLPDRPDISPCVRTTKKIELPDIDQVRKINSTMLTAEVAPVVAQIMGNKGLRTASTSPRISDNDDHATASETESGKNLPKDNIPEPLTIEKHQKNDKIPIALESEMETTPSEIEISLNTDSNSGNSEQNTAVTVNDNENAGNVKMVSDMHCIMESKSSVRAPNDAEIQGHNVDEDLLVPKSFRIVRIVRSNDLVTSAQAKDDKKSASRGKSKSKNPKSQDEGKANQDDDDENVKLSLVRDMLRKDLKRRAAKPAKKAEANKRVFVDAYEEWLNEKNVALKYFKLPNMIHKQSEKQQAVEWKLKPSVASANITNTPQIIKVFSQKATENVTVQNKVGIPSVRDRTIPLSEILKNMEAQSAKKKQTSTVIDLTETEMDDAPTQSIANANQNHVVSVDMNIQQTLPNAQRFMAPVESQTSGPEAIPGPSGAQNPVTPNLCPLNQFRTSLINSSMMSVQQPTLVVSPMSQPPLTGDMQYPYVHVATIKTTSGGCFLLMPRNQSQTEGSQLPAQQNFSNTQQNVPITQQNVLNTQQNVLNTQQNVLNTQQSVLNTQPNFSINQQNVSNTQQNFLNTQQNYSINQQNVSNTQQNVLNTQHNYSINQQNVSTIQQNASNIQQNASNTQQNVLNTQQNFSINQQNVSNTQQNVLNTQQNYSINQQNVSTIQQNASNTQQNVINTQQNYSVNQQTVSTIQQNASNTQQNLLNTQQNFSISQQNVSNTQQNVLNTQQNISKTRRRVSNTKQNVSKKHEKVVKSTSQARSQPRSPYITILPKAPNTREDSAVITPLMPSLSLNDSDSPTSIQPPLRTYSKFTSPMKILRVDSSRPHISFANGKQLVVTTGNVPCVHPTYWTLVPNKDRIRVLFPAEQGGITLYNPPAVKIDKPQADNSPFSRWLRSIFSPGTDTVKGNNQLVSKDQVEPQPTARIKVKSFARMTDEDMGETQTIAPERVCIHNQLYQKFSHKPLAYAEMLTVLPDFMTAKSLIAANIPVYLLTQSGALIDKGLNELRKQSAEFGEDNANLVDPANSTIAEASLKLAELSVVNDPPITTNAICRRNSTPMDTNRPVKIKRCSMDNPTNHTDKNVLDHSNPSVDPVETNIDSINSGDNVNPRYVRILPNVNTAVHTFDSADIGSASNKAQSINENKTDGSMDCDDAVHTAYLADDRTHSANQEAANNTDRENPANCMGSVTNFDHNYLARRTDSSQRCDTQIEFSEVSTGESNSVIATSSAAVTNLSP